MDMWTKCQLTNWKKNLAIELSSYCFLKTYAKLSNVRNVYEKLVDKIIGNKITQYSQILQLLCNLISKSYIVNVTHMSIKQYFKKKKTFS